MGALVLRRGWPSRAHEGRGSGGEGAAWTRAPTTSTSSGGSRAAAFAIQNDDDHPDHDHDRRDDHHRLSDAAGLGERDEEHPVVRSEASSLAGGGDGDGGGLEHRASGGGSCETAADCGAHGMCAPEGTCECALLWIGPHCGAPRPLKGRHLKAPHLAFDGSIVMSKASTRRRKSIEVTLPGKEKEAGGGHRVLGPVNAALLHLLPETDAGIGAGCGPGGGQTGHCVPGVGGEGGRQGGDRGGIDAEHDAHGGVYRSCAVVGSSGILLHHERGAEIDAHDVVIRFNSAPTKGLEKYVGGKTTHRITNTQNWAFRESDREQLLVHMRSRSSLTGFMRTRHGDGSIRMAAFDRDFVEHMAHSLDFMSTSGLYGIMIALLRCTKVDIYGFHVTQAHGALYHYYDACDTPANEDRDSAEWHVVKLLADEGLVRFAEPCVVECHAGKGACEACLREKESVGEAGKGEGHGEGGRLAPLDFTAFQATALRYQGHKGLQRVLTKQNYEQRRRSCPPCAKTLAGCRPPRHWAFARNYRAPH